MRRAPSIVHPLTAGHRLGPYEIVAPLGAGGMGEVYKARDTRLDRTVAIKVLPPALASDAQFRERFDREARAISQLDHPHICALHDVGVQDEVAYLVMQYLEGETLATRLAAASVRRDGPGLPLEQALTIAIQIASALDSAHRAGIVHRDLKPGNVMLTSAGAKLLDFGLAKSSSPAVTAGASMLPTTPPGLTAQGAILGTLQYMAPEQLEGGIVDARTDIFAFGALMYEMCTGKRAFEAKSNAGLVAAILEHEPVPVSRLQPLAPAPLDRVVQTCLAKQPDDRWQSARDLVRELKWIAERGASPNSRVGEVVSARRFPWMTNVALAWGIALISVIGLVTVLLMRTARVPATSSTPTQAPLRLSVTLPDGARLAHSAFPAMALSPDGTHLVYVAEREGVRRLYLRRMDTFDTKVMAGTDGAVTPFFSPDGQWVGFAGGGKLKKVSISGGEPVALADAVMLWGATWGADDTIVFGAGDTGLSRISSSGGQPTVATVLDARAKEGGHLWPHFLPDGKSILLTVGTVGTNMDSARIVLYSLETRQRRVLIEGASHAQYVSSGHILYGVGGSLMAAPFDLATGTVTGAGVPVVHGVTRAELGISQFSVSRSGALVYASGPVMTPKRSLVWVDRTGKETPLPLPSRAYWPPRLSPDGRRLAIGIEGPTHDIWVSDVERDTLARLTFGADSYWPIWTPPDGTRIVFQSNRTGPWNIFSVPVDRSGPEQQVAVSDGQVIALFLSPNGRDLVYGDILTTGRANVWSIPLDGPRVPKRLEHLNTLTLTPALSPDGKWMAYVGLDTGRNEVYVQRYPDDGPTRQITNEGASGPAWSSDGRELFYLAGERNVKVVDVTSIGSELTLGRPRDLFTIPFAGFGPNVPLEVTPDGRRFLFVKQGAVEPGPTQINFVRGWMTK